MAPRHDAGPLAAHVDLDKGLGDDVPETSEVRHLVGVVEHDAYAAGAEGATDGGEAGDGAGADGEAVEDVDGAALGDVVPEGGEEELGLGEGGDDEVDGVGGVVADLELGELDGLGFWLVGGFSKLGGSRGSRPCVS